MEVFQYFFNVFPNISEFALESSWETIPSIYVPRDIFESEKIAIDFCSNIL